MVNSARETVEKFDSLGALEGKVRRIVEMVCDGHLEGQVVVFTGAGVSAAAGIPTYRGVTGIDTQSELAASQGVCMRACVCGAIARMLHHTPVYVLVGGVSAHDASAEEDDEDEDEDEGTDYTLLQPTLTHKTIAELTREGVVRYTVTQNCDDLHAKGGLPRDRLTELHGNVFVEFCELCEEEYVRDYAVDAYSTDCHAEVSCTPRRTDTLTLCEGVCRGVCID